MKSFDLILLFLYLFVKDVNSSCRLKQQIAINLQKSNSQCFKILNATHQAGCQSKKEGNIGTVVVFNDNFQSIVNSFEVNNEPMIAVIPFNSLTKNITILLHSSDIVQGIILYGDPSVFSENAACPAFEFSLYKNHSTCKKWNEEYSLHEYGFRFLDWNKPIFIIDDAEGLKILISECYDKFNKYLTDTSTFSSTGLRCRAKMSMFMHAAGNADMCLRRQNLYNGFTERLDMCDALTSSNIYYVVPPLHVEDELNLFLLTIRLDSFSMFSTSIGGDNSVLSSLIPVLLISKALGTNLELFEKKSKETKKQVMFSFLEGESLGYIGSSRMAYDMLNHEFPRKLKYYGKSKTGPTINITNVGFIVELSHIGKDNKDIYFHVDGENYVKNKNKIDSTTENVIKTLSKFGVNGHYADNFLSSQLPPTSYQNFLRHDRFIPGFVLSADRDKYALAAVDSINDVKITMDLESRDKLIEYYNSISKSILSAITGYVYNDSESALRDYQFDKHFASELINCLFSEKWNCSYFRTIVPNYDERYHSTRSFYIGTTGQESPIVHLVEAVLVQSLGETHVTTNVKTAEQCETLNPGQTVYNYIWAHKIDENRKCCYRTSMFVTKARSPVFDDGFNKQMLNYSTWVEAVWDAYNLEIYLEGSHYVIPHIIFSLTLLFISIFLTKLDWTLVNNQKIQRVIENGRNTTVRYQSVPTRNVEVAFENDLIEQ